MKLSNLLIGLILFITMVMAGSSLLLESQRINSGFLDSQGYQAFNSAFNQQSEMNQTLSKIQASLQHKEPSLLDPVALIYNSATFLVQSLYTSLQFIYTMIYNIPAVLGFGTELTPFIWGLVAAITIAIVLAVLSATLYREL